MHFLRIYLYTQSLYTFVRELTEVTKFVRDSMLSLSNFNFARSPKNHHFDIYFRIHFTTNQL